MVLIAQRHLSFMQTAILPAQKLQVWPTLYLSDSTQPYLSVLGTIESLSRLSSDHHFFYWNRYCHNMRRNGTELKAQHIELLQDSRLDATKSVGEYFVLSHDVLFNAPLDSYVFDHYYQLDGKTLTLFFFGGRSQAFYEKELTQLGVSCTSFFVNKNTHTNRKYQNDMLYSNLVCMQASVSSEKHVVIQDFLNETGIKPLPPRDMVTVLEPSLTPGFKPVRVLFNMMWDSTVLYCLDLILYLDKLPTVSENCGTCFIEKNALYYIGYPAMRHHKIEDILFEAQSWLCAIFLTLKPCLTPTYPQFPRFFSDNTLPSLIKKYELPDGSQPSLERALRVAATNNQLKDLKLLIPFVHNINASDSNPEVKKTALHWAKIKGHDACFRLLKSYGARDDILDAQGKMAEDYVFETAKRL